MNVKDNIEVAKTTKDTQASVDTNKTNNTNEPNIDYAEEYKKTLLEVERLKEAMKKTNSENAEYKRKEREKMSESEKVAQEYKELVESKKELEERLASFELRESLSANNFKPDEVERLVKTNCDPKTYAEIMDERIKAMQKSLKAEAIKDRTPNSPIGLKDGDMPEESKAAQLARQKFSNNSSEIKKFYKNV